ncbi:hypothetical protein TNCV_2887421 [Trichonephila clavipes]|nr:hypothetical protein TNCV_2887421 [Trichonephila clavipes]
MYSAFAAWGTLNTHEATSLLVGLVEGEERCETPDHPRVFFLEIVVEPSKIVSSPVWGSKLRLTTGVYQALCCDEFRGHRQTNGISNNKCHLWSTKSGKLH